MQGHPVISKLMIVSKTHNLITCSGASGVLPSPPIVQEWPQQLARATRRDATGRDGRRGRDGTEGEARERGRGGTVGYSQASLGRWVGSGPARLVWGFDRLRRPVFHQTAISVRGNSHCHLVIDRQTIPATYTTNISPTALSAMGRSKGPKWNQPENVLGQK